MKKIQFFKEENHLTSDIIYYTKVDGEYIGASQSSYIDIAREKFNLIKSGKITEETLLEETEL